MAYIDPWGNYNEAMQGLGQSFSQISASERQRKIDEMAKKKFDMEMSEKQREQETQKGLASIYDLSKKTKDEEYQQEVPSPEWEAWNNAKNSPEATAAITPGQQSTLQGIRDSLQAEQPEPPKTTLSTAIRPVPMYSSTEIQQKAAEYMASRGDWAGLKGIESSMDITSKIDQRSQAMLTNMMKSVKEMRQSGLDNNSIKVMLKQQATNMNRLAGKTVFDPAMVDKIDINSAGDLVTQDIGGGQKAVMVTQPNGAVAIHIVDTTKERRLDSKDADQKLSEERLKQGWARLNPKLQAELEASKASGKAESQAIIKAKDDYYNAQGANALLDEAEAILNKDPRNIAGITAKFRGVLGSIDPAIEEAIGSGDRKAFERIMMNNADTFKKLLGPQISNADATLMFKLSGATASSESEIRTAIKVMRQRNDREIKAFEQRQGSVGKAAPATRPYTQASPNQGEQQSPPAYNKRTQKLQSRTVNGVTEYRVVPK